MITSHYLKSHLMSLKVQREAARKQVAIDENMFKESVSNLNRIEGSLVVVRNLITVADSIEKETPIKVASATEPNGTEHR